MKKLLLLLSVLFIGLAGCKKDKTNNFDAAKQAAEDDAKIQAYLKANNITAVKDTSGLYYQVLIPGTGANATSSSTVNVNYTGTLLDGTQFDTGNFSTSLSASANVIKGWKIGLTHINKGGRILLIMPSALGYGDLSPGDKIPANSVLVFKIDMLSINN
ncbi:FKBP-type peptidyl-prolyl cis-trans isomerase [Mucilaginibacter sp. Bleaf8]|uniref:FKBP-type peptidyl-prolyl cis-trans isomerase n=1 Tax=Mucilaginibacter sp. Bleaf8 TaxID=2834430 RepID=UPI001BCE3AAA|nr:FKBP-type peptidyl-prolyl cis-trans isomerase [Mucilaginibacter sp. Bleaf8]MBS7565867.1 FKBP-type peptidyl-prolyl cis-trans isomerase [Mucilaginibacter sp. Bleaf8]